MLLPLMLAVVSALSYPPKGYHLGSIQKSPKHTFRIETYEKEVDGGCQSCVWLTAHDGSHAELLISPEALTPLYSVDITISPDERWIMWKQKLYHPANAASLYERSSGLRYKKIGPTIFSELAWRFMSEQTRRKFNLNNSFIIRISDWPTAGSRVRKIALYGGAQETAVTTPNDHSLLISLYGDDQKTFVDLWFCYYDLERHRFYLDDTLRARNKGRVGPSGER